MLGQKGKTKKCEREDMLLREGRGPGGIVRVRKHFTLLGNLCETRLLETTELHTLPFRDKKKRQEMNKEAHELK